MRRCCTELEKSMELKKINRRCAQVLCSNWGRLLQAISLTQPRMIRTRLSTVHRGILSLFLLNVKTDQFVQSPQ